MNAQTTKLITLREKGLNHVSKARDTYSKSHDIKQKEAAVEEFKQGLGLLIQYMKSNPKSHRSSVFIFI